MKKAKIDGKIVDIESLEDISKKPTEYPTGYTAIETDKFILPLRGKNDIRPGVYIGSAISRVVEPNEDEISDYSTNEIIDFSDVDNIQEVIEKQEELRSMERTILVNANNIFTPRIRENDSPEMVALKQAVIKKNIDIDNYEPRFGSNYNNDKRLFDKSSITLVKLRSMLKNLDMKGTLIIEDANPDVPNPIGESIVVDITSNGGDE